MKNAIELIADERIRQIEEEGFTFEHDDQHGDDQLALAAACYAIPCGQYRVASSASSMIDRYEVCIERHWMWPCDKKWWKPSPDDRIRELVKAGALIVAEIERLQRKR